MKYSLYILLFSAISIMAFQCDENPEVREYYTFDIPLKVYPAQQTYKINDTISISTFLEERLLDRVSGQKVELRCEDLPLGLNIGVRHTNHNKITDPNIFDLILSNLELDEIEVQSNGQFLEFEGNIPEEEREKGKIELLKIIPKKAGVYVIRTSPLSGFLMNSEVACDSVPSFYNRGTFYHHFDMDTNNPELLEESPLPPNVVVSGDRIPLFTKQKRVYWFKVEE